MFGRKPSSDNGGFGGFLAEGAEIDGEVRFGDELRIDGRVTGRIVSQRGRLVIGDGANVEAEIEVGSASVGGTIVGTLVASQKVEIHATGKVYGNINAPTLIIEEGAIFEGHCEMAKAAEAREPARAKRDDAVVSAAS
jgi:cytoskeletal protein CcmA (bactofilin family)